mmetsp:Transcript_15967/g.38865  ORF Transcript_15967/g.38865 Transcript_15967/m.38865 type:complete len:200 (+) Transcript_15967:1251-1850(+)
MSTATNCHRGLPSGVADPRCPGKKASGAGSNTTTSRASSMRSGHHVAERQSGAMTVAVAPSRRSLLKTRGSKSQGGFAQHRASAPHGIAKASNAIADGVGHRVQKRGSCLLVSDAKRSMVARPQRRERSVKVLGFNIQSEVSMNLEGSSAGLSLDRTGRMKTERPSSAQRRHAARTIGISVGERDDPRRSANSTEDASI